MYAREYPKTGPRLYLSESICSERKNRGPNPFTEYLILPVFVMPLWARFESWYSISCFSMIRPGLGKRYASEITLFFLLPRESCADRANDENRRTNPRQNRMIVLFHINEL